MLPLNDSRAPLKFPIAVTTIMFANAYFFMSGDLRKYKIFVPSKFLLNPLDEFPTLLSSLFIHGGLYHLITNMLFLWVFGNRLERYLKTFKFLLFYFCCGIFSFIGFTFFSEVLDKPVIGASGAISAVLGAYLMLFPKAQINALFFWVIKFNILKVPAWIYISGWVVLQYIGFTNQASGNLTAWSGHLTGFALGLFIFFPFIWCHRKTLRVMI